MVLHESYPNRWAGLTGVFSRFRFLVGGCLFSFWGGAGTGMPGQDRNAWPGMHVLLMTPAACFPPTIFLLSSPSLPPLQ
jgi:hypothetical protein